MSVKATSWVWYECEVAGADRMVLLALADFADESGLCFGSWTTLEHKTKLSRSTIARSLTRLEKDGVLTKVQSSRTVGGRNLATVWKLPVGGDVTVTLGGCHNDTGGNVTMTPGGCHGDTPTERNIKETSAEGEGANAPRLKIVDSSPNPPLSGIQKKKSSAKRDGALGLHLSDADWMASLAAKPEYAHLNVYSKRDKLLAWCAARGEKLTRQRLKKCLDKDAQDQVMAAPSPKPVRIVRDEFEEMKRELAAV